VNRKQQNKQQERHFVEVFKAVFKDFPEGEILCDENQERPDALVKNEHGSTGIEVTRILHQQLRQTESETESLVAEASRIYQKRNLPNLHLGVTLGSEKLFDRSNRTKFATALADLVAANVPERNGLVEVENDWSNPEVFPFEIHSVLILRNAALTKNHWTIPSFGWIVENFTETLQQIITKKERLIHGYDTECNALWLLIVAENGSAASFFDPSPETQSYPYASSFDRVFFLDLFKMHLFELTIERPRSFTT